MEIREKLFEKITSFSLKKPWIVFGGSTLFTVLMGILALGLHLDMTWYTLIPKGHPSLKNYKLVLEKFGSEGGIIIVVENPVPDSLLKIAEETACSLSTLKKYVKSVTLKQPENFLKKHGLMLTDSISIKSISNLLTANIDSFLLNLNNETEKEYIQKEENLQTQELQLTMSLIALEDFLYGMKRYLRDNEKRYFALGTKELLFGPLYFKSLDNKMVLISVQPKMPLSDLNSLRKGVELIRELIKKIEKNHPKTKIRDTGIYSISRDEYITGLNDMNLSTIVSFILVIFLFILGFRILQAPLLAGVPLIFGIVWDLGITRILIGRLNIMTASVAVILIGLGIDYSIHIFQASTEKEGVRGVLGKAGKGIFTGAITTAAAFFSLYFTNFDVLKELGLVISIGIISTMVATTTILPALIRLFGKKFERKNLTAPYLGKVSEGIRNKKILVLSILAFLLLLSPFAIKRIKIETNPIKLEAPGLSSVLTQDTVIKRFGMSTDYIMVLAKNIKEAQSLADSIKKIPGVSFVDGIHLYLPSKELQQSKIPYLKKIHSRAYKFKLHHPDKKLLLSEIRRLKDNIAEIETMSYILGLDRINTRCNELINGGIFDEIKQLIKNSDEKILKNLNKDFYSIFKPFILDASMPRFITMKDIPQELQDKYVSSDGSLFLLSIFLRKDVWEDIGKGSTMDKILKITNATGLPILMRILWEEGKKEAKKAVIFVFIIIFIILLLDFKSFKLAFWAYLPVIFAFLFTFAVMGIVGVKFNFLNVLALPLIIGIGIDDAVHVIHRYLKEGSSYKVFTLIGRAILYTSLTTIAAFGSLLLCKYQGYTTFGAVVVIGVAMAFITTLILLPILLKFVKPSK